MSFQSTPSHSLCAFKSLFVVQLKAGLNVAINRFLLLSRCRTALTGYPKGTRACNCGPGNHLRRVLVYLYYQANRSLDIPSLGRKITLLPEVRHRVAKWLSSCIGCPAVSTWRP